MELTDELRLEILKRTQQYYESPPVLSVYAVGLPMSCAFLRMAIQDITREKEIPRSFHDRLSIEKRILAENLFPNAEGTEINVPNSVVYWWSFYKIAERRQCLKRAIAQLENKTEKPEQNENR